MTHAIKIPDPVSPFTEDSRLLKGNPAEAETGSTRATANKKPRVGNKRSTPTLQK